ncbi:hypothetical protein, partial [Psychrobacter sp. GW64-MNA-CIBAN-0177]
FIPQVLVKDHLEKGELFHVKGVENTSRDVFVAYHRDNEQKDLIETLVNLLSRMTPSLLKQSR